MGVRGLNTTLASDIKKMIKTPTSTSSTVANGYSSLLHVTALRRATSHNIFQISTSTAANEEKATESNFSMDEMFAQE